MYVNFFLNKWPYNIYAIVCKLVCGGTLLVFWLIVSCNFKDELPHEMTMDDVQKITGSQQRCWSN